MRAIISARQGPASSAHGAVTASRKPRERPPGSSHRDRSSCLLALRLLTRSNDLVPEACGGFAVAQSGGVDLGEKRVGAGLRPRGTSECCGGKRGLGAAAWSAEMGQLVNSKHCALLDFDGHDEMRRKSI